MVPAFIITFSIRLIALRSKEGLELLEINELRKKRKSFILRFQMLKPLNYQTQVYLRLDHLYASCLR